MKSSIGMVSKRIPRFSAGLYLTTGWASPVPVRIPFTRKKGISSTPYTVHAFPNQFIRNKNFKIRQVMAVLTKVEEVYSFSRYIIPSVSNSIRNQNAEDGFCSGDSRKD